MLVVGWLGSAVPEAGCGGLVGLLILDLWWREAV